MSTLSSPVDLPRADLPGPAEVIQSDAQAIAAAQRYAETIAAGAADRDRERRLPIEELAALARTGLLGIRVPRRFGGAEVSYATVAEVFRIISRADPSIGQTPQNHFHFLEEVFLAGTEAQQSFFAGEFLRGARLGNALSERGGTTALAFQTRLTRGSDGGYRLSGRKYYSTGALTAQWIPVFAFDPDEKLVTAYLPRDAEGVTVEQDWDSFGQRATMSGTTILEDVAVSPSQIVPFWKLGSDGPSVYPAYGQLMHVAVDLGIAEAALADTIEFLTTRARPFFQAGVEHAWEDVHVQHRLGELISRVRAAALLLERAAQLLDEAQADPTPERIEAGRLGVLAAKPLVGEIAVEVASELFTLSGTGATSERYDLDRHWRNARTHTLHDPARWKYAVLGEHALTGKLPDHHPLI
jgi:SfnB family sulfur acquisition oxidoreductase